VNTKDTSWFARLVRYTPLPLQSMFVGLVCGLIVWQVLDFMQDRALEEILGPQFAIQLKQRAGDNLVRLDGYMQRHKLIVSSLASSHKLVRHLGKVNWNIEGPVQAMLYQNQDPPWLLERRYWPKALGRGFLMLIDQTGYTQEIYPVNGQPFPEALLALDVAFQKKTRRRAYLANLEGKPYLLVSHSVSDLSEKNEGVLMLAVPVDERTLIDSQGGLSMQEHPLRDTVIALLDTSKRVLTSSAPETIIVGSTTQDNRESYNLSGRFPFEFGGEGEPVELAVLFSQEKFAAMSDGVLMLDQQQRFAASVIFVIAFTSVLSLISVRTNRLLKSIETFSREALGIEKSPDRGNQIVLIEDRMQQLIQAVLSAKEETNKLHEIELRESNALKSAIFKAALDCIITIDLKGEICEFNPAAEAVFGYEAQAVLGQDAVALIIPQESRAEFNQRLMDSTSSLQGRRTEIVAMHSNGNKFLVELSISVIELEGQTLFTVYLHDITERKKAEAEIQSLAKFPAESPSPIVRVNHHGVIIYVNDASEPLMRYWACSIGQTLPLFWKRCILEALEQRQVKETEVECGGSIFSLLVSPVSGLGYVNLYGRDITAVREAEDISRQHQAELVHVCRLSTMGEMATGLAHELNQPLAAIVNYASGARHRLASGVGDPAQVLDAMEQVSRQAERAGEIIRRLRGMVGKREMPQDRMGINEVISDALSFLEFEVNKAEVSMQTQYDPRYLPVVVDAVQIEQVLLNLIRNATEAMRDDNSPQKELIIGTTVNAQHEVEVSIQDTGPGISQEVVDHLFDPFFTTKNDGMGMGLSISQTIINNHEGRLWAIRNPVRGTTFYFTLPIMKEVRDNEG